LIKQASSINASLDPLDLLYEYYPRDSGLTRILIRHSEQVRDRALEAADKVPHLKPDKAFIAQAAMLHDIGIGRTSAAKIGCRGKVPYICHGVIGRCLLEKHGLHAHALVCERHVGVGITVAEIKARNLPLPCRDMQPVSIEEIIICYADKFFSKTNGGTVHSVAAVTAELARFGVDKVDRFLKWHRLFSG